MEHVNFLPITMDANGDVVIRRGDEAVTKHILESVSDLKDSYELDMETMKQELKKNTQNIEEMRFEVAVLNQKYDEDKQSYVAKIVIRNQLQMERHRKAKQFVHENVQLSIEEIVGTKGEIEKRLAERLKRETTQVMLQITSYVKRQLGLRSIEDIPNGLVDAHKTLVRDLTWKKLKNSEMKGAM